MTSLYYRCQAFEQSQGSINYQEFKINQKELVFRDFQAQSGKVSFLPVDVEYRCHFHKSILFDSSKPSLLMPIKDNSDLLAYTIKNLLDNKIETHSNIIIIDDRSQEPIRKLCSHQSLSYLRVDNHKGFNFSMLNNIAAKLCHDLGNDTIILWNSDLWTKDEESFLELLKRHRQSKSKISGAKLAYPPQNLSLYEHQDSENIKKHFPSLLGGKWRNTIQFGGDLWLPSQDPVTGERSFSVHHNKRFSKLTNPLANCNRPSLFVTGALQIIDLHAFVNLGGLNPSLSKNMQDVDLCLKFYQDGNCPMYFGEDLYFYHDESLSMYNLPGFKKQDQQMMSDQVLFGKIWNTKIGEIVLGAE